MMKLRLFIILSVVSWAHSVYADGVKLPVDDPDALLAAIEKAGTKNYPGTTNPHNAVIDELLADDHAYNKVLAHIETGDEKWLKVADALGCCVDAGPAEELGISIAIALTHSPEPVLRRQSMSSLRDVCTVPLIEPTKAEFEAHVKAVKAALQRVKDPALQEKKMECLKEINAVHWVQQ